MTYRLTPVGSRGGAEAGFAGRGTPKLHHVRGHHRLELDRFLIL